jgi:hypothetical protein
VLEGVQVVEVTGGVDFSALVDVVGELLGKQLASPPAFTQGLPVVILP